MKKILIVVIILIAAIVGAVVYLGSGANDFIRTQIETQGTKYLATPVSVASVDLSFSEGRLTISDIDIENPDGFSDEDALSLDGITLNLGGSVQEPYQIQEVTIDGPEILYELDSSGQGNLIVLKNNLAANLPTGDKEQPAESSATAPKLIVDKVVVSNTKLILNFEQLETGDFEIDKKAYEVTLPTFNAGAIGQPDGLPADQVGAAIVRQMLDNAIKQAKAEAKKIMAEKAKEKIEEEKDKLLEKGKDKLKDLFN
ncbi:MAG: AsmA family protein [Alteromonadaceae bacterium]|nr:AsmA family protein [Alteromonadaceae bacterium]